jgi:HlyD family secretion protein
MKYSIAVPNWIKEKPKVPKWALGLLMVGLIAGSGFLAYNQITQAQRQETRRRVQTATAERLTLPVTISANGVVQPTQSVNVSPKTSGILKRLMVKEGDRVTAGQILAYMDDANLQGQLTQAKAQVASAEANLNKLNAGNRPQEIGQVQAQLAAAQANLSKLIAGNRPQEIGQAQAQVASAQAELQQAESTFRQNQQLAASGAISQRELTTSQAAYESAKAKVAQQQQSLNLQQTGARPEEIAQARAQVEQLKQSLSLQQAGSRPEDIDQARAQLISAQGALQTIQTQVNDTIIRAPFDGIVTRKFADPGAFVTPTTSGSSVSSATSSSILSIASTNEIQAKVSETNIPKIKVGQTATIEADAFPNQPFPAKVTQVATQSTVDQNVTNFTVKLAVEDPKRQLQAGMNATVKFNVGTLDNALVVPTVAIVRQDRGTGVFVAGQGERPRFKSITTGATIADKTVVVSGLEAGDKVLMSFPQGERPVSRTPSILPGMGGGPPGGSSGGGRRGGG